jgi:hypothetical protein
MNSKWNDSFQVPSLSRLRYPKETSSLGTGTRHSDECLFGHFLGLFPPQATISLSLPRERLLRRVIRRLEVRLGGISYRHVYFHKIGLVSSSVAGSVNIFHPRTGGYFVYLCGVFLRINSTDKTWAEDLAPRPLKLGLSV